MKKVFLFSSLLLVLFLTGCSSSDKKLVCNQSVTSSGVVVSVDMITEFSGDEVSRIGLEYGVDLSSYTDAQISAISSQDMCTSVKAQMASYANAFTNCKQDVSNKKLKITADLDVDKLAGIGLSKKTTVDEAKKAYESQGYTCTIN